MDESRARKRTRRQTAKDELLAFDAYLSGMPEEILNVSDPSAVFDSIIVDKETRETVPMLGGFLQWRTCIPNADLIAILCSDEPLLSLTKFVEIVLANDPAKITGSIIELSSVLILASRQGLIATVRSAVSRMASFSDEPTLSIGPLLEAAENGHLNVVQFLLESNYKDSDINDAYVRAADRGQLAVLRYLLDEKQADINYKLGRALRVAIWSGQLHIIKHLLEDRQGKEIVICAPNDILPLAARNGHLHIIKYFLNEFTDNVPISVHDNDDEALTNAAHAGHLHVVKYLLEREGEQATIDARYGCALELAVGGHHLRVVQYLLDERIGTKAEINTNDNIALRIATKIGNLEIVRFLLDERQGEKADVHANNDEPLKNAAWLREGDMAEYLLEKGANPERVFHSYSILHCSQSVQRVFGRVFP